MSSSIFAIAGRRRGVTRRLALCRRGAAHCWLL